MKTITPTNEDDLATAIQEARGPLAVSGGATRGIRAAGQPLKTTALSGIKLYEPGALTMVAGVGTPLDHIEQTLATEGQMLAFEPIDLSDITAASGNSTIGGVFASNASGARRVQVGAARDFLLGVRFVDGAGNVIKNGGRVMKNVTGYDLVKLMAGSHGTLGVLSEVSFKVLPMPETAAQVQLFGLTDTQAVAAMAKALGSPFDVSGAMHLPEKLEEGGCTCIRVEGFEASVAYRAGRLKDLLAPFADAVISDARESWQAMRRLLPFSPTVRGASGALWRLAVKPSDGPALMARIAATHDVCHAYDWGGARIWVWARDADVAVLHAALQAEATSVSGHATLVHTPVADIAPRFQPEPDGLARLSAGLRAKFDPRGILNTGVMG